MNVDMDERPETEESALSREHRRNTRGKSHIFRGVLISVLALICVAAVVVSGILPRMKATKALQVETEEMAVTTVSIVRPKRAAAVQDITLPASIQAFTDAPIYARTNGYLKSWHADIGSHVKAGQLLAEIDTPEIEQQIQQARADLATAEANARLAEITAARYQELLKAGIMSRQDTDTASGNMEAKKAALQSAQYNVKRLEETQSFSKIYAPFDGVITARNTDIGALIDSGSSGGAARELFHIAATQKLRVFVHVPQAYSQAAKPGMPADITMTERPGRVFHGTLVRTSDAIDAASRTLLAEIELDNSAGEIFPGSYADVHLKLPGSVPAFLLPVNALMFRADGLRVAVVGADSRIVLTPITPGRDFGTETEVVAGLSGDESVVVNPPDSISSGDQVQVAQPGAK